MAEVVSPITRQVTKGSQENVTCFVDINLRDVEDCLIYDRHGVSIPFKTLYQDRKSVIIFVRVGKTSFGLTLLMSYGFPYRHPTLSCVFNWVLIGFKVGEPKCSWPDAPRISCGVLEMDE